ncbi:MAG: hypothetical protein CM15mP55_0470 [Hyphomicrobiales bacterium]|nr:MAG: hypothetical protein CM15mP55_0470 [Hyphomicrobiales bacterium]
MPIGAISLIETVADAETFIPPPQTPLAFVNPNNPVSGRYAEIIAVLRDRFRYCRAAQRRHLLCDNKPAAAVKKIAPQVGCMLVIGAPIRQTRNVWLMLRAARGAYADLIEGPEQITWSHVKSAEKIGLTAGASAPEEMVAAVIAALQGQFSLDILEAGGGPENVHFKLPRQPGRLMAVYTEIDSDTLAKFAAQYPLSQIDEFKGITAGVQNSNFLLKRRMQSTFYNL